MINGAYMPFPGRTGRSRRVYRAWMIGAHNGRASAESNPLECHGTIGCHFTKRKYTRAFADGFAHARREAMERRRRGPVGDRASGRES